MGVQTLIAFERKTTFRICLCLKFYFYFDLKLNNCTATTIALVLITFDIRPLRCLFHDFFCLPGLTLQGWRQAEGLSGYYSQDLGRPDSSPAAGGPRLRDGVHLPPLTGVQREDVRHSHVDPGQLQVLSSRPTLENQSASCCFDCVCIYDQFCSFSDDESMQDNTSVEVRNAAKEKLLQGLSDENQGLQWVPTVHCR